MFRELFLVGATMDVGVFWSGADSIRKKCISVFLLNIYLVLILCDLPDDVIGQLGDKPVNPSSLPKISNSTDASGIRNYSESALNALNVSTSEYKPSFTTKFTKKSYSGYYVAYLEQNVKWDEAYVTCKMHDGYLLSILPKANTRSTLYSKLKEMGIEFLWTGIHRRANYYIQDQFDLPRLFKHSNEATSTIGDKWHESEDFFFDCVALSLKSGRLMTKNCSLHYPFVCEDMKPPQKEDEGCPEAWYLSPPLSKAGRTCISEVKHTLPYDDAANSCSRNQSRLASRNEYRILKSRNQLYFKMDDQEFWALKESNESCTYQYFRDANSSHEHPSCVKSLPFVCVRSMEEKNLDVIIEVGSSIKSVDPFQIFHWNSACKTKAMIFCHTKGHTGTELHRRWYKDDLPVYGNSTALNLSFLEDTYKRNKRKKSKNIIQGNYHCELRIPGSVKTHRSRKIDLFFPDVATYVIDIHGVEPKNYVDYSHRTFDDKMLNINGIINKILGKTNADWDFKSIQRSGESYSMKLIVFEKRNNSYNDENSYKDITRKFKENVALFKLGENVSSSVYSADVCFNSDLIPYDKCKGIKWPTTKEVKNVLTETTCLNEKKKFIHRECKGNSLVKAEWSPFDCSACNEFLQRYQDKEVSCPNGYHKLNSQDICFKIYYEKKSWFDAYKTCSEFSSYLLDIPHEIYTGNVSSLWLSFKFSYGKIQGFGQKPINLNALYEKEEMLLESINMKSHELYCVSAVKEKSGIRFMFADCSEEMPFVCVQKLFEEVTSSQFKEYNLYKQNNIESCYYLQNSPYSWKGANEFCEQTLHGAKLLSGVQDINSYSFLKKLIVDQYRKENKCDVTSWWMDFESVIQKGMPSTLTYIDWGPSTDFNITMSHGVITLFPDKKVYWSLEETHKKLGFICEVQKCYNKEPTSLYIEKKSSFETNGNEDAVFWLESFNLSCISSGWYITDSISWYKDNILFDDISSYELSFHSFSNLSELMALELQGDYSCSVDMVKNKETVYSSQHLLRIPGFYTFIISMITEAEKFLVDCPKYVLSNAFYETTALYQCFRKYWKDTLNFEEFHFRLKTLTCYRYYINITIHLYFQNHLPEEEIFKVLQKANYNNFSEACNIDPESIIVKSTAYCYSEAVSLKNTVLRWRTTALGESSFPEQMCLTNEGTLIERRCLGDFKSGAFWSDVPATECNKFESSITEELLKVLISENIIGSLPLVVNLTSNPELLTPPDVQAIAEIFSSIALSQKSFPCDKLYEVVEIVSNSIDMDQKVLPVAANYSNRMGDYLENITSNIGEETCNKSISTKNVHVNLYPLNSAETEVPNGIFMLKSETLPLFNASAISLDFESQMPDIEAGLVIPKSLLHRISNTSHRVVYCFLENMYFQEHISVISIIISVSFHGEPVIDLGDEEISLLFKLKSNVDENNLTNIRCAFWNSDSNTWSSNGCFLKKFSHNFAFCTCNHLTSFAVIMVKPPPDHLKSSLMYITYIGSSLSCIGLTIIILSFIFFREWRVSVKNKCLCNYSLSYLLFLAIYMAGIDKTNSGHWCKVTAVLLHYFLLTSFLWMIVLAYTVYLSLVKVLPTYIPRLIQKAMAFAWGLPVVIVGSILSSNFEHYLGVKYCWCSEKIFTYGIVIPMISMLAINYFIFATIVYVNICGSHNIKCNQDKRKLLITRAKALFCISILLGLSWIFRFFAVKTTDSLHLFFTYLFTIATAFQGLFLAIFFIFLPQTTRQLWIKLLTSPKAGFKPHSRFNSSYVTNQGTY